MDFPEARLPENRSQDEFGAGECSVQAVQEPRDPKRDVQVAVLGGLQVVVVRLPLDSDLRGQTVEPARTTFRPRQGHVGYGSAYPAVSVLERVDRDEPQVRDGR